MEHSTANSPERVVIFVIIRVHFYSHWGKQYFTFSVCVWVNSETLYDKVFLSEKKNSKEDKAAAGCAYDTLVRQWGELSSVFQENPQEFLLQLDDIYLRDKNISRESIDGKVRLRDQARKDKDWARSDQIRDELKGLGIDLHDSPAGTAWEVRKG